VAAGVTVKFTVSRSLSPDGLGALKNQSDYVEK
jgi:hypothetical protein